MRMGGRTLLDVFEGREQTVRVDAVVEAVDYPVPGWLWAVLTVIVLATLVVMSLLTFIGKPPK